MKSIIIALAILFVSSTTASAVKYEIGGNGGLADFYEFTDSGVTVTATPGTFSDDGSTVTGEGEIGQYERGLGVTLDRDNNHDVDGTNGNELIFFEFSEKVYLQTVSFTYYDESHFLYDGDQFTFFADKNGNGNLELIELQLDAVVGDDNTATFTFLNSLLFSGTEFAVGAFEGNFYNHDAFKISGMTVSAIPLLATLPLYGAGLAILGFIG
ncbi:MAG: hypothetical protein JKX94_07735 [Sneathiella sp.]|nr:hypothetical protein [Sneathiella sp.]